MRAIRRLSAAALIALFSLVAAPAQFAPASLAPSPVEAGASNPPVTLVETPGTKMRTNAASSALSNPATNPPWAVAGAWATGQSEVTGSVVLANSHLYINVNGACTTAGAGGGPSAVTSTAITDNTCSWYYFGEPSTSASDAAAPTISSSLLGGSPAIYYPALFPSVYKVYGATAATFATNYWSFTTFNNKSGNAVGYGYKVCADVTDSKFDVRYTNASPQGSVIIDGRYYSPQAQFGGAGTPNGYSFDFTGSTGYKKRNVCLQSGKVGAMVFAGFGVTSAGSVTAPAAAQEVKAVWLYDSYDAGSSQGPFSAYGTLGAQVSHMLGWTYWPMGQGGTGLQNAGSTCSTTCYTYIQRVQDTSNAATIALQDIILFNVSTNDAGQAGEQAAVAALLAAIRTVNPTALIVGIGPAPLNTTPTFAQTQALDTAGAAAFAAYSDPAGSGKACYIPFANAVSSAITGSFVTTNPGNSNSYGTLIANGDLVHPTDLGDRAMAPWLASQIATQCLPNVR